MLSGVSFVGPGMSQKLPQRTQSPANNPIEQLDPMRETAQDVERARRLLDKHISSSTLHAEEGQSNEKNEVVPEGIFASYAQMIEWVEKLVCTLFRRK